MNFLEERIVKDGIVKEGNTIKLEYSLDGITWATAKTFTDAAFGNDYQLGFGTWTSTNSRRRRPRSTRWMSTVISPSVL